MQKQRYRNIETEIQIEQHRWKKTHYRNTDYKYRNMNINKYTDV